MNAIHLQTEHLDKPMGVDHPLPHFTWNCEGGVWQSAFRVEVRNTDGQLLWDSGKVPESRMQVRYGGTPLRSRTQAVWRVMLWDENGVPGPWSKE